MVDPKGLKDRIITFAEISAKKMSSPAPTAAWAAASIRKSPGPSCAPCATAQRSRARSCGVEFKSACADERNKKQESLEGVTLDFPPFEEPASFGATWELRLGPRNTFRIFYDVDHEGKVVSILAIGVKDGNRLYIGSARGREGPSQCLCRRMREQGAGRHHAQRQGCSCTARPERRRRFGTADIGALASFPALAQEITEKPKSGQRRFPRQILENGRPASWSQNRFVVETPVTEPLPITTRGAAYTCRFP